MKKTLLLILVLCLLGCTLCGCNTNTPSSATDTADSTITAESSLPETKSTYDAVDLTVLSSTMVYAEVYNMMVTPTDYIGRTVKMQGQFAVYEVSPEYNATTDYYFAIVIADATACCQQGLEFVLADETLKYPDEYPELGSEITVTGEFQTYQEGSTTYCHLVHARIESP
jgi:hypothetical protein